MSLTLGGGRMGKVSLYSPVFSVRRWRICQRRGSRL